MLPPIVPRLMVKPGPNPLLEALRGLKGPILAAALFSAASNLLLLLPALYMLQVYDRVLQSRSESTLLALTVIIGAGLLVMALLEMVRSRILVRVGASMDRALSTRVFNRLFAPEVRLAGATRSRPLADLNQVRQFLTGSAFFAIFDSIWIPIYVLILFLIHPLLGWLAVATTLLLFVLAVATEFATRKRLAQASDAQGKGINFVESSLRNADVLDAMGMLDQVRARWRRFHQRMLGEQALASDRAGMLAGASKFVMIFTQSLLLGGGAWLAIQGTISPGLMIAGAIIGGKALQPVQLLVGQWQSFVQTRLAWKRLSNLLAGEWRDTTRMPLPAPKGQVTALNVIAAPPNTQTPVLRGVSLDLSPGEIVAVIGPSGSGKSTFARTLTGVWPIAGGEIRLDGAPLSQWPRSQLGEAIGYLPQDVELFEGTVAENIARLATPDPERVVEAAKLMEAHEMILRLPQGYNTQVGEGGRLLSGGQRQRIGLARAVYGNPAFCVFDEPNSNLDDQGEQLLGLALRRLKEAGKSVLVISHRPSTLNYVDKVLVLQAGQVAFFGTRQEALARFTRVQPAQAANG